MNARSTKAECGTVRFVGAGPGDPELLTLKAQALLRRADVVLHDDLVAAEIVSLAAPHAQIVNVGKRCGDKRITQSEINERMIRAALGGLDVVRLKSGDPGIFGRLAEEIEAVESAGVPFEVVPGITAGSAATASIGASLTDRRSSSRVVILSGHHASVSNQNNAGDFFDLSGLACENATIIVYMPGRNLVALGQQLMQAGLPAGFPALIVSRACTRGQQQWATTLGELGEAPTLEAPSILLLGRALEGAGLRARSKALSMLRDSGCRPTAARD